VSSPTHLGTGDEHAPEGVAEWRALHHLRLQVEHGDGGAEEVREVMQQDEAVPESRDGYALQVVVLHGNLRGQLAGVHRLQ
jgi:hypothetical protein